MIGVAWRDDGLWPQLWWIFSLIWKRGRIGTFPPRGFVGRASGSFLATDPRLLRLRGTRLHRLQPRPSISRVPLWRLICEWETPRPASPPRPYGVLSELNGNGSGAGGADGSIRRTGITSI